MQHADSGRLLAEAILSITKSVFGSRVFDVLVEKMTADYFGKEMDVHTAITQRPGLFERAFLGMLGEGPGTEILARVCEEAKGMLDHSGKAMPAAITSTPYSRKGDFAKFVRAATTATEQAETTKVVIVDDDDDILTVIKDSLAAYGFSKVHAFNDPINALEHFKTAYDNNEEKRRRRAEDNVLVLTDMRMAHMDGLRLAEELLNVKPDAKIVLMSAHELDVKMLNHLRLVSTEDPLQKPFEMERLRMVIKNAAQKS